MKKIFALALAMLFVLSAFAGCGDKSGTKDLGDALLTIDGDPVYEDEFLYTYFGNQAYYDSAQLAADEALQSEFEGAILTELQYNRLLKIVSEEEGISLTDDEYQEQVLDQLQLVKDSYGDNYEQALKDNFLSEELYIDYLELYALYTKLYASFTEEGGKFDGVTIDEVKEFIEGTEYIRAKHVLLKFEENESGDITNEEKAANLKLAQDVLKKLNEGADFDEMVVEYGEDPGMEAYPGGYYFTEGEMVTEFYEGALALEEGQYSDIIETTYGYHIIQRLPFEDESMMAYLGEKVEYYTSYDKFMAYMTERANKMEVVYGDKYNNYKFDGTATTVLTSTETSDDSAEVAEETTVTE